MPIPAKASRPLQIEKDTDNPINWNTWAARAGYGLGYAAVPFLTSSMSQLAAAGSAPIVGALFIGLPLTFIPWMIVDKRLNELLVNYPKTKLCYNFVFHAAMGILTGFIGFAILSSFASIGVQIFAVPALIAVGISAAIALGTAIMILSRLRMRPVEETKSASAERHAKALDFILHKLPTSEQVSPTKYKPYIEAFGSKRIVGSLTFWEYHQKNSNSKRCAQIIIEDSDCSIKSTGSLSIQV